MKTTTSKFKEMFTDKANELIATIDSCTLLEELERCERMIDNLINMAKQKKDVKILELVKLQAYLYGYLECKIKNL